MMRLVLWGWEAKASVELMLEDLAWVAGGRADVLMLERRERDVCFEGEWGCPSRAILWVELFETRRLWLRGEALLNEVFRDTVASVVDVDRGSVAGELGSA